MRAYFSRGCRGDNVLTCAWFGHFMWAVTIALATLYVVAALRGPN